jgi:hypothetical protein
MSSEPIVLTREALYQQVWAEPIIHVAKRLGLSDRGLAKVCARHQIPVPPRGWWAKKQHGQTMRQAPLPAVDGPALATLTLHGVAVQAADRDATELEREQTPEWRISVPEELPISHPLVVRASVALRQAARGASHNSQHVSWRHRYQVGLVRPGPGHLDMAISKPLIPRALRIMQALLTAFDQRGYTVSVNAQNETVVSVLDEPFQMAILERQKQVRVKRTYGMSTELEPSGFLRLRVGSTWSNAGTNDRPNHLVENALNRFIAGLVRRALDAKRERAIRQAREASWDLHDQERRRREQVRHTERLRGRHLRTLAAQWVRQERLRHFLAAVDQRLQDGQLDPLTHEAATQQLVWAGQQLQHTDPVSAFVGQPWPVAPLPGAAWMPAGWESGGR